MSSQATIYDDCLSGDVPCIVRSQKSDGSCNILRFSQIRSGTLTEEDITYILIQVVLCGGSKYQSRRYGVATDVFLSHLSSDIFRQVDDTRFAGAV